VYTHPLSSHTIGAIQEPAISGRQSSVSTKCHPAGRGNVRLLTCPSGRTPLQPSRPRVQATRSPGRRLLFPHPPPSALTGLGDENRSFSQISTVRISERQWRSNSRSSSRIRVSFGRRRRLYGAMVSRRRGKRARMCGCVNTKGAKPRKRIIGRRGTK